VGPPQPTDSSYFWHIALSPRRNKSCKISYWSVVGFSLGRYLKFAYFHRKVWSSLTQCLALPRLHVIILNYRIIILLSFIKEIYLACRWYTSQQASDFDFLENMRNSHIDIGLLLELSQLILLLGHHCTARDISAACQQERGVMVHESYDSHEHNHACTGWRRRRD
jgi:hypothetical protein